MPVSIPLPLSHSLHVSSPSLSLFPYPCLPSPPFVPSSAASFLPIYSPLPMSPLHSPVFSPPPPPSVSYPLPCLLSLHSFLSPCLLSLLLTKSFCISVGVIVFYIVVIIYLYGDLAIYTAAVPKSLANVSW